MKVFIDNVYSYYVGMTSFWSSQSPPTSLANLSFIQYREVNVSGELSYVQGVQFEFTLVIIIYTLLIG